MLVAGFPADLFATNCYVLATGPGEPCVVVDPGVGVTARLDDLLAEHRLHPVAVLLTHGHFDHTFSVTPVCDARDVPAYIHPDDREMLVDPTMGLSLDPRELFGGMFTWSEPSDVVELPDGAPLRLAGLELTIDHAPGHTRGSVLVRTVSDERDEFGGAPLCLAGDVLFAGSIGRTDLPGGDPAAMQVTLRDKILSLADETVVLPGHGPATTIGRERAGNPFLRGLTSRGPDGRGLKSGVTAP